MMIHPLQMISHLDKDKILAVYEFMAKRMASAYPIIIFTRATRWL